MKKFILNEYNEAAIEYVLDRAGNDLSLKSSVMSFFKQIMVELPRIITYLLGGVAILIGIIALLIQLFEGDIYWTTIVPVIAGMGIIATIAMMYRYNRGSLVEELYSAYREFLFEVRIKELARSDEFKKAQKELGL